MRDWTGVGCLGGFWWCIFLQSLSILSVRNTLLIIPHLIISLVFSDEDSFVYISCEEQMHSLNMLRRHNVLFSVHLKVERAIVTLWVRDFVFFHYQLCTTN